MKILAALLLIPFLATQECCQHKGKHSTGNDNLVKTDTTIAKLDTNTSNDIPQDTIVKKPTVKDSLPACIRKFIDEAPGQSKAEKPLAIDEYIYNGKTVYLYTAPCCDHYNTVYDENCKEICAPSGGFTGRGDGKCPDFQSKAKHVRSLWKVGK